MVELETFFDARAKKLRVRAANGTHAGLLCQFPSHLRERAGQRFRASVAVVKSSHARQPHLVADFSTITAA